MKLEDLKHIAPKGQGYFCLVKQYSEEATGNMYALKELKKTHYDNEGYRYRLNREIKLLIELQGCENIIELINHGNNVENKSLWYLMPFAKFNLYEFIRKNNNSLSKIERFNIIEQIISAIKFAHERDILHRDISPNNVLIFQKEGKMLIKVSDFGLGKDTESLSFYTGSSASGYGHILYVSPEQRIQLKDATNQSDIYSLGKLVYFVFTGKDPDNLKPFELSTLVAKATEEYPQDRFKSISDFEEHFHALRELHLNQEIPIEHLTLKEVLEAGDGISLLKIHELFVAGTYVDHVYHDYISPVNTYLLFKNNLTKYIEAVGNSGIRDFARTYSNRLDECYQTYRWPFKSMSTFGKVLSIIIQSTSDDETRLICFKQLWYLAFEADQWDVQSEIKKILNSKFIAPTIETQLAECILQSETEFDLSHFSNLALPKIIKANIIKAHDNAKIKREERERQNAEELKKMDW